MPEPSQDVYHCPECGALGKVEPGEAKVCGECGYEFDQRVVISPRLAEQSKASSRGAMVQRNVRAQRSPAARIEPVVPAELLSEEDTDPEIPETSRYTDEVVSDDGRKKVVRRRKKRKKVRLGPLIFLGSWAIAIMFVVIILKQREAKAAAEAENRDKIEAEQRESLMQEMKSYVEQELPDCNRTLSGFLQETTWEKRAAFVRDPFRLAPAMHNFYERDPLGELDQEDFTALPPAINSYYQPNRFWELDEEDGLDLQSANLFLYASDVPVIETVYIVEPAPVYDEEGELAEDQPESYTREVSFVRQDGEWKIDWENLVWHSDYSWPLFITDFRERDEPRVFRLYMQRVGGRFDDREKPVLLLKFFKPHADLNIMWRHGSPSVRVPLDSDQGRRLQELLDRGEEEWDPGDSLYPQGDPKGLFRVRVELQWKPVDDERRLVVTKVLSGNWLGEGYEDEFRTDPVPGAPSEENEDSEDEVAPEGGSSPEGEASEGTDAPTPDQEAGNEAE